MISPHVPNVSEIEMPLCSEVGQKRARELGGRVFQCSFVSNSILPVHKMKIIVIIFVAWVGCVTAEVISEDYNPYTEALKNKSWESVQRYVEVRPGAFIFYWLYYADGTSSGAERKPLIIWVQGGPGLAATGLGNFAEIGPLNMDMKPRNHTWVKGRNVLLIDQPVGTGFSYVTEKSLLVKTDRMMAIDLTRAVKAFFRNHKEFRKTPTYIFSQSYGSKISPRLTYCLQMEIQKKRLKMNLQGLGVGSGLVDTKETNLMYPEYLYNMGLLDYNSYIKCVAIVKKIVEYIDKKDYEAANIWRDAYLKIALQESDMMIRFNNMNQENRYPELTKLEEKVNKYVKPTLKMVNQSLEWVFRSRDVFESLKQGLFMPATKFLEMLLNKTQLNITIYNGNLDLVTPLAGATNWVHKLKWHGAEEFRNARRVLIKGINNGYYKKARLLSYWTVFGAGHWVPEDNPAAMEQILDHLISSTSQTPSPD